MAQKDKKAVKDSDDSKSEIIHRFKQNPALFIGTVVVLVLVIVSFVLVPAIVPETVGGGDLVFGYYDKIPISWIPGGMFSQYRDQAVQYYQRMGIDINNYWAAAEIWRQSYEAMVVHTAILQMMKRSNYSVPERTVDRNVAMRPEFQENGRFSSVLYNRMSDSARLVIWRQTQDELNKIAFYNDYFGLLIPSSEAVFVANMGSVMRNFEMVYFKVDDYPDSEYRAYAGEHADLFASIHLSRITIGSGEREARRILDTIKDGTVTFEEAAITQSQDSYADRGGDMGIRYSYELAREIPNSGDREKIFALGIGELSDIVSVGENRAIFRVEEAYKQADFEDEATMEMVRSYLRNFERGRMEDWAVAQASDFIAEVREAGFDNVVFWRNMEKHKFGPFPMNYGGIDLFSSLESFSIPGFSSDDLTYLSRNENFWNIAFSTPINTPAEPLVQGSNVIVLIPTEQIEVERETLDKIALDYESYWLTDMSNRSLQYYFINNGKLDDRFWDVYRRYLMP